MQALYLGMRGMVITTGILFLYFLALLASIYHGSVRSNFPPLDIAILAAVSSGSAVLAFSRQEEFRKDMIQYMIGEFCVIIDLPDDRN